MATKHPIPQFSQEDATQMIATWRSLASDALQQGQQEAAQRFERLASQLDAILSEGLSSDKPRLLVVR